MSHTPCRCPRSSSPTAPCVGQPCAGRRPQQPVEASGILNIAKAEGWTSHDVVARVRRLVGQRRVGHAGTLDPFATGVLLICLGQATRVSEYLMAGRKVYRGRVRFGVATDTYDATGTVTAETSNVPASLEEIEALLPGFTGRILQAPPAYSALKVGGQPAYRRTRRGEEVALAAREVEIYGLKVLSWAPPDLEIEVQCGPGTYIRSLAHDLGQAAGSAAHLASLERCAVGHFTLEGAISLADLETCVEAGCWQGLLYPLDEALLQFPALVVSQEDMARLVNGRPIAARDATQGALRRVYGPGGEFIALVQGDVTAGGAWQPHKVFAACLQRQQVRRVQPGSS